MSLESLLAWLPLVVFLALFIWLIGRSQRDYKKHVNEVNEVNQQIVDTNREMIAELKQIKEILRDK